MEFKNIGSQLLKMNFSDVLTLEIKNEDVVFLTYITKIKWIDSPCYILGGVGDKIMSYTFNGNTEIDEEDAVYELITDVIDGWDTKEIKLINNNEHINIDISEIV